MAAIIIVPIESKYIGNFNPNAIKAPTILIAIPKEIKVIVFTLYLLFIFIFLLILNQSYCHNL